MASVYCKVSAKFLEPIKPIMLEKVINGNVGDDSVHKSLKANISLEALLQRRTHYSCCCRSARAARVIDFDGNFDP